MFGETTRAQATHSLKFGPYSADGTALRAMQNAVIISQMPLNMHTDAKVNPVVAIVNIAQLFVIFFSYSLRII